MTAHAVYAPSAASRWFRCPGSINLSKDVPYRSSVYADEGSAAHELAARCFTENKVPIQFLDEIITINGTAFVVTEEMCDAVSEFTTLVNVLAEADYKLHTEVKLDLGHLHPGQFGTGDAILYKKKNRHLVVIDLKYGRGVEVFIEDNPQLLSYASGAARQFGSIKSLTLMVCQPRISGIHIKKWDVDLDRLIAFENEFRAAVERTQAPDAPLVPGDHCRFCPAFAICPAIRAKNYNDARVEFADILTNGSNQVPAKVTIPTVTLTNDELGAILDHAALIENWIEAVRRYALDRAITYQDPPTGWKLVRKNTHRKWLDEVKAADVLHGIFDLPLDAMWQSKLISPAQAEKLVGKQEAKSLSPLVVKPAGDATLAPIADRREPLSVDARAEFRDVLKKQLEGSLETELHD